MNNLKEILSVLFICPPEDNLNLFDIILLVFLPFYIQNEFCHLMYL